MKEKMPDISFERSMNHNYMILSRCDFFGGGDSRIKDYRTRMLLENRIPGLLPVTHRQINGESRYYYEINSLQSLDRLYDKSEIRCEELKKLLSGCVSLFERLEEYLLDGAQIIMKPELIYIDVDKMEPYFVCYPEYEGDVRLSFMEFVDELLTKIDHTDECAVMLGYQVYRYTRNSNYVISEIGHILEHVIVEMARKGAAPAVQMPSNEPAEWSRPGNNTQESAVVETDYSSVQERNKYCPSGSAFDEERNYSYDEDDAYEEKEQSKNEKTKSIGDLIGGIFCIFVSLCAGAVILGARMIKSVTLSGNNELYLFGAMGMAVMAAVLFFSCYIKKRKQDRELEEISGNDEDCEEDDYAYYSQPHDFSADFGNVGKRDDNSQTACQETVCLGDNVVEERVLYGRLNGREINVPLNKLPMTVGKLASVADFVINDTAVSKMHARFEEHDGRVYVCDLNSTNGTVKNGVLLGVNQSVKLEPGDRLRFGRTCFTYC